MHFPESGCTKNVCGKACLDCYLNTLTEKDAQKLVEESCSSSFRLGMGIAKHQINPRLSQLELRGSECNNEFCRQFNIIMKFTVTEESWSYGITEEHNADYLTTSRLFTSSPNKVISIFKRDSSLSKFT